MVLQDHIPRNPKRYPLPLLLTRQFRTHPRPALLHILTSERSSGKHRLPPVLAGTLHVLFALDGGDALHPRLGSTPDGLVEGEKEGVIMLSRFGLSWEEGVEEGEKVGFACSWGTGDENTLIIGHRCRLADFGHSHSATKTDFWDIQLGKLFLSTQDPNQGPLPLILRLRLTFGPPKLVPPRIFARVQPHPTCQDGCVG